MRSVVKIFQNLYHREHKGTQRNATVGVRQTKRADRSALPVSKLLRCQFLGLAFGTHEFERALGLFVRLRNFFLHLGRRFFHFWR